jgi:hypothetical protein
VLKKNITYKDFNGNEVTDLFTFNLSPADLMEIEAETPGGMSALLAKITETTDGAVVMGVFKTLINRSVGKVSENGKQFLRNEEILNEFRQSNAYSVLLIELISDEDFAATFFNSIMPEGLDDVAKKIEARTKTAPDAPLLREQVPDGSYGQARSVVTPTEEKVITKAEAEEMNDQELLAKVKNGWIIKT